MTLRSAALIFVLAGTTLTGLFDHDLWAPDEPRAAELGREFLDGGSWAVPRLNGEPFLEKPPLVYWSVALSLKLFGVHDGAARLPALLFGLGTLLFTGLLARRLYGPDAAVAALLLLSTCFGFLVVSHHLESDAGLVFFMTAASFFLWKSIHDSDWWYGAVALSALGAFFSKGPLGLILPALLFAAWVAWSRTPRELLRARPWIWIPLLASPVALWLAAVDAAPGSGNLHTFLVENQYLRFLGARGEQDRGHLKPFWYYFVQLPLWFLPGTLVLVATAKALWRGRNEPAARFLLSWAVTGFLFFCAAGSKRAVYMAPLLPPLAILAGAPLAARTIGRRLELVAAVLVLVAGIAWATRVTALNERRSCKPFCRELDAMLPAGMPLYAYDVDETALAVVPFYTGRRLRMVEGPAQIPDGPEPVAVLTMDNHGKEWHSATVSARFPHLWLSMPEGRDHRFRVFSNVERR